MDYYVESDKLYPTEPQDEAATQFEATLAVLDRLGLKNEEAEALAQSTESGNSADDYKNWTGLIKEIKGPQGLTRSRRACRSFSKRQPEPMEAGFSPTAAIFNLEARTSESPFPGK